MRAALVALGAFVMAVVSFATAPDVAAQPTDYRAQIDGARARLRDSPGDVDAWLELNAGVRAALFAEDYRTVLSVLMTTSEVLLLGEEIEAAGIDLANATDPEVLDAFLSGIPAAVALEVAAASDDRAGAREALQQLQDILRQVWIAAERLTGTARLDALLFVAEDSAVTGMDSEFVRQAFAALRDEVLTQVVPQALARDGCRTPAGRQLSAIVALTTQLGGDPAPAVRAFNQRQCTGGPTTNDRLVQYRGEGTLDYTQEAEYAGVAYRVRLLGTYTVAFDAPTAGGAIEGSGEADLTATLEDATGRVGCGGPTRLTLRLEVGGSAAEELEIVIEPGALPTPPACSLPASAPVQLGLPDKIELSVNEQSGFTTNSSGSEFRVGPGYRAQWTYRVGLTVRRLP